jgi:hypothetical protein
MRTTHLGALLVAAMLSGGCFQVATVVKLKGDGSGTIEQRILFTQAAMAQMRQLAAASGGGDANPLSEQQARDAAPSLGQGVTFVSSVPIDSAEGVGREIVYAFSDVTTLKLDQSPSPPGGPAAGPDGAERRVVSFDLTRLANGNSRLTIRMPQLPALPGGTAASPLPSPASPEQFAVVRQMLAGARVEMSIEPAGKLVHTSSPYVAGQRVTLLEMDVDALLAATSVTDRLQHAHTPEEMKAILKSVPGLKVNLDPELTIEFQ